MIFSSAIFLLGFFFSYLSTKNIFSIQMLFGYFYFMATFLSSNDVFLIAAVSFCCLALGSLLYNLFNSISPRFVLSTFRDRQFVTDTVHPSWTLTPLMVVFLLSLFVSVYYYLAVGISLFSNDVGYDRLVNRYSIPGARVMQRFFRVYLPIVLISYYLFRFSPSLKRYFAWPLFFFLGAMVAFLLIAGGMRGNIIIFLFLPFVYIRSLIGKISIYELLIAFLAAFVLGLFVSVKMYVSASPSSLFEILWSRFTTGASDGLSVLLGGYTEEVGFQWGRSFYSDIASIFSKLGILSDDYISLGEQVALELLGNRYNGERAAVYFSGELYHNFGYIGVILGSLLIGYFIQYLYLKTIQSRKDIIFIATIGFVTAAFNSILGGPVLASLIDYGAVFVLLVCIVFFSSLLFSSFSPKVYCFGRWIIINRNYK